MESSPRRLVMHSTAPASLIPGQYDFPGGDGADRETALIIEADMTDSRVYSEAQVRERVEAFIESL